MRAYNPYIQNRVLIIWGVLRSSVNVKEKKNKKLTVFLNKNQGTKIYTKVQKDTIDCIKSMHLD